MITPSFGLTATERVLPSLTLDFTTALLDSRVTFTRSGGTATRVNASGYVETVAANTPRFDYDPITLACKGLLIEESRTNSATGSALLDSTAWGNGGTGASRATISSTAPDGSSSISRLTLSATSDRWRFVISVNAGQANYFSVWLKGTPGETVSLLAFRSGAETYEDAVTTVTLTSTFQRVSVGKTWLYNHPSMNFCVAKLTGNTATQVDVWGAQLEAGAFPTSYIPTTTAQVTRTADVATMTGTDFSDWFNASEGTFVAEASYSTNSANCLYVNDSTTSNRILLYMGASAQGLISSGGTAQASLDGGTPVVGGTLNKVCLSYKADNFGLALQGGSTVTDTAGTVPTVSQLNIGAGPGGQIPLCGVISGFEYYPQRLTNAEIKAFSKG